MSINVVKTSFFSAFGLGATAPSDEGTAPQPADTVAAVTDAYGHGGPAMWMPQLSLASAFTVTGDLEPLRKKPNNQLNIGVALTALNASAELPPRPQRRITSEQEQLLEKIIARSAHKTGWVHDRAFELIAKSPGIDPQKFKVLDALLDGRFAGTSLDANALLERVIAQPQLSANQASALQAIIRHPMRGNDATAFDSNLAAQRVLDQPNLSGAQMRVLREIARTAGGRAGYDCNASFAAVASAQNLDDAKATVMIAKVKGGRNPLTVLGH